jgi:hypothetical protein
MSFHRGVLAQVGIFRKKYSPKEKKMMSGDQPARNGGRSIEV